MDIPDNRPQPETPKDDLSDGEPTGLPKADFLAVLKKLQTRLEKMSPSPPNQRVKWAQVESAIPEETAAFAVLLEQYDLTLEDFCVSRNNYVIYDEEYEEKEVPEEVGIAWTEVQKRFSKVTGLKLHCYAYEEMWADRDSELHDYQYGFEVAGVWQMTDAGKRFFGEDCNG